MNSIKLIEHNLLIIEITELDSNSNLNCVEKGT